MECYSMTRLPPSISSGFPDNSPVPIYTPGLREVWWESIIFPKNTAHWPDQVLYPDLLIRSPVHWVAGQCISQGWEVRLLHAMETSKSCGCMAYLAWIKTLPFSFLIHIFPQWRWAHHIHSWVQSSENFTQTSCKFSMIMTKIKPLNDIMWLVHI